MEGHHAARAQRMDLLDHLREKTRDEESSDQNCALKACRREPAAVLLGRLSASLKGP